MESHLPPDPPKGRVLLWKFGPEHRSYIGWNLTADEEGCTFLVDLLEGMQASAMSPAAMITTVPATAPLVKAVTGSRPLKTVGRLVLHYSKGEPQLWITGEEEDTLVITFGDREVELLQTALLRVVKGESDFAIGDEKDEQLLYFWGYLGNG